MAFVGLAGLRRYGDTAAPSPGAPSRFSGPRLLFFYLVRKERPPGYISGDENMGRGKMRKSLEYPQQTGL